VIRLFELLGSMTQVQRDQQIQGEIAEICNELFQRFEHRKESVDAVDREVEERQHELIRRMGFPIGLLRPGDSASPAVADLLERASADAQEHLDAYLNELDDPVLDYLIEVATAAKDVAEAARAAAGGAE
jgi:predicted transcriptional regulator